MSTGFAFSRAKRSPRKKAQVKNGPAAQLKATQQAISSNASFIDEVPPDA
jgi:hypothetical protein